MYNTHGIFQFFQNIPHSLSSTILLYVNAFNYLAVTIGFHGLFRKSKEYYTRVNGSVTYDEELGR